MIVRRRLGAGAASASVLVLAQRLPIVRAMASRLTSSARLVAAVVATVVVGAVLAPVCRMPSCDGGSVCGHPASERSRFTSACGHEAPEQDGGSCGAVVMRHEDPGAPSVAREAADTQAAAAALADATPAERDVSAIRASLADSEAPPVPPPDPLFGKLVI